MLPTLAAAPGARRPSTRSSARPSTARTLLLVLVCAFPIACGNKGDLYLPASLDEELELLRIDTPSGEALPEPLPEQAPRVPGSSPLLPEEPSKTAPERPMGETGNAPADTPLDDSPDEPADRRRRRDSADGRAGAEP